MKLTILTWSLCVVACFCQNFGYYKPLQQHINPSYVLVPAEPDDHEEYDRKDDSEELTDTYYNSLPRNRGGYPSLQQYHHNENVNQYYYPFASPSNSQDRSPFLSVKSRHRNRFRPSIARPFRPLNNELFENDNARFFGPNFQQLFFPSLFYSYLSGISTVLYSTSTSILVLNTTLSTTLLTTCVPAAQFIAGSSTVNCRRKRGVTEKAIALDHDDIFGPSEYPSNENELQNFDSFLTLRDEYGTSVDPEIVSSKDTEVSDKLPSYLDGSRFGRSARFTVTSTFTSYSFITLNATRTVTLGNAGAVSCLPAGYRVC